jgi:hypothetical protein
MTLNGADQVTIYNTTATSSNWVRKQKISISDNLTVKSLAISTDKVWLAIAKSNGQVDLYKIDDNGYYNSSKTIIPPQPDSNFGYKLKFAYDETYSLIIGSSTSSGKIYQFKQGTVSPYDWASITMPTNSNHSNFDVNQDASILAISNNNSVLVYAKSNTEYTLLQTISNTNSDLDDSTAETLESFGSSIALSTTGKYLAISGDRLLGDSTKKYVVEVYNKAVNYSRLQRIENKNANDSTNDVFGRDYIKFVNNEKTLIVSASSSKTDIYDRYENKFIYSESLNVTNSTGLDASDNIVILSDKSVGSGIIYSHKRAPNTYSWSIDQEETARIDLSVFKKIFLYNRKTNQLITYLDIIDPTQGKISGIAERQIKYKTYYDPATFSFQSATSGIEVVVDDGMAWLDAEVGTLWWDLRRAKFLDAHLSDVVYKNTIWNTLYETASIDVYEWVSSKYTPANWDKLADTDEGLAQGVSGKSLYGDDVYSIKRTYDTIAKTFISTYYYWVKNKTTIPNISGRTNSAADISNIISNPKGSALKYIEFTNTNSFSLTNVKDLLSNRDVVLAIQYWTIPNHEINIHSEWKIISENEKTEIPKHIEQKWIDSLVGFDKNGKMVPDLTLPPKQRFGIESKPRQSMFVNRLEAVKQVVERINSEFKKIQIDSINLTDLLKKDLPPTPITGEYDYVVDTETELKFIKSKLFNKPSLSLDIKNGSIVAISIVNNSYGYGTLKQIDENVFKGPNISIIGKGTGAVIDVTVNAYGVLNPIKIKNGGKGYDIENTFISVRPLTVLVRSDSTIFGNWAVYAFDPDTAVWSKVKLQYYDVTAFWHYIDWYGTYTDPVTGKETSYDQYSKIDHVVEGTYELFTHDSKIGQTVKVNNVGSAGWMLLVKYSDIESIDYTQNYRVVGRQNGSIQLSSNFYNFRKNRLGYDTGLYDTNKFDNSGATELRIILNSLKDKILIDDRRILYLNLFFLSIRYALHEQPYLDWIFKSSFVKALHNVGSLRQKVTYSNDNLEDFENYIAEVKPYRTKIREFVSGYTNIDQTQSMITDFDLPSYVDKTTIESIRTTTTDTSVICTNDIVNEYPWKLWKDNIGFAVKDIIVSNKGKGYTSRPTIKIIGDCTRPARARAFVAKTQVVSIEILDEGAGYLRAPTIIIEGHLSVGGTQAQAVAVIKNDLVRSSLTALKFDRYTKQYIDDILPITCTDTFQGDDETITFNLRYTPNTSVPVLVKFTIEGITINVPSENYNIIKTSSKNKGHTVYYAQLVFDTPPTSITEITVEYTKDFKHLTALERIKHYYDPTVGMIGKDFSQLMNGIDYGGVNIVGTNFDRIMTKWDSDDNRWDLNDWDNYNDSIDDVTFKFNNDSTYQYELPYTPDNGQEINIYVNNIRIDDPYFDLYDGSTEQPNGRVSRPENAMMNTFIGDGSTNAIRLPDLTDLDLTETDLIIFRKTTSDGSIDNPKQYDTIVIGGDVAYATATGLQADDIILDGDKFISPMTSPAPEEMLPGHVVDTLVLKVFDSNTTGSSNIICDNYYTDGVNAVFKMGQSPNSKSAVIVKLNETILKLDIDYTIDFDNLTVTLTDIPEINQTVSIITLGLNGSNILQINHLVVENTTNEIVTNYPWKESNISLLVLVSGEITNYTLFESDKKVAIRFAFNLNAGQLINYMIFETSAEIKYSIVSKETITYVEGTDRYNLVNPIGNLLPLEYNAIVKVGNEILNSVDSFYFILKNQVYEYDIPLGKADINQYSSFDFRVYIDNVEVLLTDGYDLYLLDSKVVIKSNFYVENAKVVVTIRKNTEYTIGRDTVNYIEFNSTYADGTEIEIISMFNHDILDIQRTDYQTNVNVDRFKDNVYYFDAVRVGAGIIGLQRPIADTSYAWVIKNKILLTPKIDYVLNEDKNKIILNGLPSDTDKFSVITFSDNIVRDSISFMQFKDMLNRVHYKRISQNRTTELAEDLHYYDKQIVVEDPACLNEPNISLNNPGVIYVNGERIEYFIKEGNTLSQLRRGTWGTGIATKHEKFEKVLDIGSNETVPYRDREEITTWPPKEYPDALLDSTHLIELPYVPTKDGIEVFVGGVRQRKDPYTLHDDSIHPESPEGDVEYPADFSVDDLNPQVRLEYIPTTPGVRIQVIRKTLTSWNDPGKTLADSTNSVAYFLKINPRKLE